MAKKLLLFILTIILTTTLSAFITTQIIARQPKKEPTPKAQANNCPEETIEFNNYYGIKYLGLTEQEAVKYLAVVKQFEKLQKKSDAKGVLSMFTQPTTEDEKNVRASLLGADIFNSPRLYQTRAFSFYLNWYVVKTVQKDEKGTVKVDVLESRTFPFYEPEGMKTEPEPWFTKDDRFIIEITPDYKIDKYYLKNDKESAGSKYDGFDVFKKRS